MGKDIDYFYRHHLKHIMTIQQPYIARFVTVGDITLSRHQPIIK